MVYINIFIHLSWCISRSTFAVFDHVSFFYPFIGTRMTTVLCWKPVFVTMWPSWWISTLRGNDGLTTTECFECVHLSSGVFLWLFGSRACASVWHSCSFACRKKTERSKKFFLDLQAKEHVPSMVNPKPCGHLCCCIIQGCEQVGATYHCFI